MAANRANIGWYLDNQIGGEDDRLTGRIYDKKINISAAEILLLNSVPKKLVAAPGVGKVIDFVSAVFFLDYGTTAYNNSAALSIRTITGTKTLSESLVHGDCLELGADGYVTLQALPAETALDDNDGLELVASTVPGAGGGGTLTVKVMYRIHDFN